MTDATPTQPTGSGKLIWRKPLTEDVIEFGTLPDPRDARIAELEAALREIRQQAGNGKLSWRFRMGWIKGCVDVMLMPMTERDMVASVEEWDA